MPLGLWEALEVQGGPVRTRRAVQVHTAGAQSVPPIILVQIPGGGGCRAVGQERPRPWAGCGAEVGREHLSKGLSFGENHREDDEARGRWQLGPDGA